MEVRAIKTCQGFQKVLFLDGALLSAHDLLGEVPQLTKEEIEILDRLSAQWMRESRTERMNLANWARIPIPSESEPASTE
jgi:hypothetical protein